jgi:fucose permease
MALCGAVMISLGPLLDPILRETGIPRAQGGLLSLAFFLGMNLAILGVNLVLGGLSSRATLITGAAVLAAGLAALGALARSLPALGAALALTGLGYGILNLFPGMYVTSLIKEGTERAMTIVHAFFAVGVTATPIVLGRLLAAGVSWRTMVLAESGLAAALLAFFLVAPVLPIAGRKNVRAAQLQEIRRVNGRLWALLLAAVLLYVGLESIYNVWLALFQIDVHASGPFRAGIVVTLFWAGMTIGRLVSLPLVSRAPTPRLVAFACAFTAACILVGSLSPSRAVSEAGFVGLGVACAVIFPLLAGYAARFPAWLSAVVFSTAIFASGIGAMTLPALIGPAAKAFGFRAAMALGIVPAAAVAVLAGLIDRATRRPR